MWIESINVVHVSRTKLSSFPLPVSHVPPAAFLVDRLVSLSGSITCLFFPLPSLSPSFGQCCSVAYPAVLSLGTRACWAIRFSSNHAGIIEPRSLAFSGLQWSRCLALLLFLRCEFSCSSFSSFSMRCSFCHEFSAWSLAWNWWFCSLFPFSRLARTIKTLSLTFSGFQLSRSVAVRSVLLLLLRCKFSCSSFTLRCSLRC